MGCPMVAQAGGGGERPALGARPYMSPGALGGGARWAGRVPVMARTAGGAAGAMLTQLSEIYLFIYLSPGVIPFLPGYRHPTPSGPRARPAPGPAGPAGSMSCRPPGSQRRFPEALGQLPPQFPPLPSRPCPAPTHRPQARGAGGPLPAPAPRAARVRAPGCCPQVGALLPPGPRQPPCIPPSRLGPTSVTRHWAWGSPARGLPGITPSGAQGPGQEVSPREWGWGPRKALGRRQLGGPCPAPAPGPCRVPWAPSLPHRGGRWPRRRLRPPSRPTASWSTPTSPRGAPAS